MYIPSCVPNSARCVTPKGGILRLRVRVGCYLEVIAIVESCGMGTYLMMAPKSPVAFYAKIISQSAALLLRGSGRCRLQKIWQIPNSDPEDPNSYYRCT